MKKLLKVTAVMGVSTAVNIIVGIIRAKFTALSLGPQGIGIFSQAGIFSQTSLTICSLGIIPGIVSQVSKYWAESDAKKIELVTYSAIIIQLIASLLFAIIVIIFSANVSVFLFSTDLYYKELIFISIAIPFMVLSSFENIFFSFEKYGSFTMSRIIGSITGLILLVILILLWGLRGGLIYFSINSLIIFTIIFYFISTKLPIKIMPKLRQVHFKFKEVLREADNLIRYGAVSLIISTFGIFSILLLRSLIIKKFGAEANGIYQVVFAISSYYFPFLTSGIWGHYYSKISGLKSEMVFSIETNNTIRLLVMIITPVIALLLIFKKLVVILIFSRDFLSAQELFSGQLIGDFFFLLSYIFGSSLLARARLRAVLILGIGYNLIFVLLFLIFYRVMGLKAITTAFALSNLICFLSNWYYHTKDISLKIEYRNIKLISFSLLLISIVAFTSNEGYYMIIGKIVLLLIWFWAVTSEEERLKVKEFLIINLGVMQKKFRSVLRQCL